jgi:hypothetical protein
MKRATAAYSGTRAVSRAMTESPSSVSATAGGASTARGTDAASDGGGVSRPPQPPDTASTPPTSHAIRIAVITRISERARAGARHP